MCWSLTAMFFAAAGRRIGSFTVNQLRLVVAIVLLAATHAFMFGVPWPATATGGQVALLVGSGLIGLAVGDTLLFRAYVVLGVKGSSLMMTLWPAMAFVIAWPVLGERPGPAVVAGMVVTLLGVVVAVLARRDAHAPHAPRPTLRGVLLGAGGAMGQALGAVVAKPALTGAVGGVPMSALSATLLRMVAAAMALWLIAAFRLAGDRRGGRPNAVARGLRDPRAVLLTALGAVCGPFVGVWLSLVAIKHASVAVATTLMAIVPILVMPWMFVVYRDRPRLAELAGAAIAVAGVLLLFAGG